MTPTIERYRQRPPELDALLIDPSSGSTAVEWLRAHGRDAWVGLDALHVLGRGERPGFDVPFGAYLITDGPDRWAVCPAETLNREYAPVRDLRPWEQRYGTGTGYDTAPPPRRTLFDGLPGEQPVPARPGQPGRRL
jgi:hypothetical protein